MASHRSLTHASRPWSSSALSERTHHVLSCFTVCGRAEGRRCWWARAVQYVWGRGSYLVVQLQIQPALVWRPHVHGAHAADGQRLQQREPPAGGLSAAVAAALPPLVVLFQQVQRLPGRQHRQGRPNAAWWRGGGGGGGHRGDACQTRPTAAVYEMWICLVAGDRSLIALDFPRASCGWRGASGGTRQIQTCTDSTAESPAAYLKRRLSGESAVFTDLNVGLIGNQ